MTSILINAANLHVGGGVQVAVSFIYEMGRLTDRDLSRINVIVSSEVDKSLSGLGLDFSVFRSYRVFDLYGFKAYFSPINREIEKYEVVFTVFGPNYLRVRSEKDIVGFAQAWIFDFPDVLANAMGPIERIRQRIKRKLQWLAFMRSDTFVVELEHVRKELLKKKRVSSSRVFVVYNTVSSIYYDKTLWRPVLFEMEAADLHLGIVSRDYNHKNLSILPDIAQSLLDCHGLRVRFYVTFKESEWKARNDVFKTCVSNVGELLPSECPSFYEKMDGVIFPSLLECFSATPLEALVMGKPLFASDRNFVRDICNKYAFYFDPLNADDIANVIARYYRAEECKINHLADAKRHAESFSNAKQRALNYLKIIDSNL